HQRDRGVVGYAYGGLGEAPVGEQERGGRVAGRYLLVKVAHRLLPDLVAATLDRDQGPLVVAMQLEVGLRRGRVVGAVDGVAVAAEEVEQHRLVRLVAHAPDRVDDLLPFRLARLLAPFLDQARLDDDRAQWVRARLLLFLRADRLGSGSGSWDGLI